MGDQFTDGRIVDQHMNHRRSNCVGHEACLRDAAQRADRGHSVAGSSRCASRIYVFKASEFDAQRYPNGQLGAVRLRGSSREVA